MPRHARSKAASASGSARCAPRATRRPAVSAASAASAGTGCDELKAELVRLCGPGTEGGQRTEVSKRVEEIVEQLAQAYSPPDIAAARGLMQGRWRLLSTFTPGQGAADWTSLDDWREYIFGRGPSPVQAATLSNEAAQRVYQAIDLSGAPGRWHNVVEGLPLGILCLQADLSVEEEGPAGSALKFQWTGGFGLVRRLPWAEEDLAEPLRLPYPVPFALLGDRARGSFDTLYLDGDLRVAVGAKSGSVYVLAREPGEMPLEEEYMEMQRG